MRKVIGGLFLASLLVPLMVVQLIPTNVPQPFVFQARIEGKLGETLGGRLRYFLVEHLKGKAPTTEYVVLIDFGYTLGHSNVDLTLNQTFWGQGPLMTSETHPGDWYLFFGHPQIFVRQIKGAVFWPDQVTELKILYLSPLTRMVAPAYVVLYLFDEYFAILNYVAFIVQTLILVGALVLGIKKRHNPATLVVIALTYVLLTMLVTSLVLTDLYYIY